MFFQTLKTIEKRCRDVGRYRVSYEEFKQLCKKFSEEDYNYLCFDRSEKRYQGRFCNCNKNKNTYIECTLETKPF